MKHLVDYATAQMCPEDAEEPKVWVSVASYVCDDEDTDAIYVTVGIAATACDSAIRLALQVRKKFEAPVTFSECLEPSIRQRLIQVAEQRVFQMTGVAVREVSPAQTNEKVRA